MTQDELKARPAEQGEEAAAEASGSAQSNIVDALAMPDAADIEFDPPRVQIVTRPAEL